jgi:hypothetical protein
MGQMVLGRPNGPLQQNYGGLGTMASPWRSGWWVWQNVLGAIEIKGFATILDKGWKMHVRSLSTILPNFVTEVKPITA